MTDPNFEKRWSPVDRAALPGSAVRWLRARVGPKCSGAPDPADPPESNLPESALPTAARTELGGLLGTDNLRTGPADRLAHAGGMSYLDLVDRRRGEPGAVPDAVVLPAGHDVAELLRVCARHDVAVVPFGGGTSVVGGVDALRGGHAAVVAVDLARLDRLLAVDRESLTATLQAGLTAARAETLLGAHGLTLGHLPQSFERATLGGFAATRSAGQASTGYGRFDQMVTGLRLVAPAGELVLGRAPASAAGPDLRHLVLGSEGTFGIVTEVTVRVRPHPDRRRYEAWSLPSFRAGADAVRTLVQNGPPPDVVRLSDPTETQMTFTLAGPNLATVGGRFYLRARGQTDPCLLVLGWEGTAGSVRSRRAAAAPVLRRHGAAYLGQRPGRSWRRHRFAGPRLRDALLDVGMLVETLETAADWSGLSGLRATVTSALDGALDGVPGSANRPVVGCHLSHAYPTGGSLYFTVLAARDRDDPVGQWLRARRAAGDAVMAGGGTMTHHHAVGLDHREWLAAEIGELGVEVLRAVRARLDPDGICNPGKLIPPAGPPGPTRGRPDDHPDTLAG
ncbi:MAG TPA: FAD-binding oxidoreductase [Mycobacteriales bacterium]|nr:FAD-binding oxidoreductase [Mycobacteriales bacterium]